MQSIDKREPAFFADFVRRENPTDWRELSQAIGAACRTYMLSGQLPDGSIVPSEQNFQCAYTGIRVELENSHIDHFRKQSLFPALRFDWNNLIVSTNENAFGARYKDKVISSKAANNQLMDPARENPAEYFEYTFTGEILPSAVHGSEKYRKAEATIAAFNLNDRVLVNRRATAIRVMEAYYGQLDLLEIQGEIREFDCFLSVLYVQFPGE